MNITINELKNKIQKLQGMNVSFAWKGYGSAIFLELGNLTKEETTRSYHQLDEACIWLELDWRVEKNGKIIFGSSNSCPDIEDGLKQLVGKKILGIEILGEIPELKINFSEEFRVQTMAMVSGDPQWNIRQKDSTYLLWENCNAIEKKGDEPGSESSIEEKEYMNLTDKIAKRLGRPIAEPMAGTCCKCKFYFPIDSDFALLDYGVCVNELSKLDQHIVRIDSGCSVFLLEEL
jgi:hypothetical protein